jgi:hypothetical protein
MVIAKSLCHIKYLLLTSKVIKSLQTSCILHVAKSGQMKDVAILELFPLDKQQNINQRKSVTGDPMFSSELASV